MKIIIDRFEGDYAVAELPGGTTVNIPRNLFPGAVEGDVYQISKDAATTDERRDRIQGKFDRLKSVE